MSTQWTSLPLDSFGVLRVSGVDVVRFLQGQLSHDIAQLTLERSLLCGFHNPQGRAIALLRLLALEAQDLIAVLPRELIATVQARLTKVILRAKVQLRDESREWTVRGLSGPTHAASATDSLSRSLPQASGATARINESVAVRLGAEPRWLLVAPVLETSTVTAVTPLPEAHWRLLAIAAGEPQVYAATSEQFVAQMLNLDAVGALAFDKGCYTGQEVIARAHYRGRVKRRMQRFVSDGVLTLAPGDSGVLRDGRAFKVVEAAQHDDGRCEFLAVAALEAGAGLTEDGETRAAAAPIAAQQPPLPYPLPE